MHLIPVRPTESTQPNHTTSGGAPGDASCPAYPDHVPEVVRIAGLGIAALTPSQAVQQILRAATAHTPAAFHFINAYTVSLAASDIELKKVLNQSTATFPDGRPLSWFARIKSPAAQQVRGPSMFEAVFRNGQAHGTKHFLLGSTPETLELLVEKLQGRHPEARIVGTFSPPYRLLTEEEVADQDAMIRASGADIVWVGLGTPKQDFEVQRVSRSTGIAAAAVGAAFDFSAGTKREAPAWLSPLGLEWLFRLLSEPRRLWRRYLIGNPLFLLEVLKYWRREQR
ncbi:WecB/TagA/CpsF family glycosyltransferase [Kocuria sp. M4R2S49]|uniref:WecB/TagA/CpsF family glycosyltransferase n=1 Tax=Kocuria rhizosphaericola TaxID=3376284 RepID=UPI0037B9E09D